VRSVALGIVLGFAGDRVLGDPARAHPVSAFGRVARTLEARTYRPRRSAGALHVAALVGAAALPAAALDRALARRPHARSLLVGAVLWAALGGRSLGAEARGLAEEIRRGDLGAARRRLPALAGRDPEGLDRSELCRAAVESVAENTADAVVGPLLWCALAGPAGAAAYRAANTLDALIGHRSPRYERFGWAAARLDDVLTWPAARLASALAVALAPLAGGDPRSAWRILRRDGRAHPSPNAGRLEAAFAGALWTRLGGVNRYGGRLERRPRIGDGPAPDVDHVERAVRLSAAVGTVATAVCALLAGRWGR